MASCTDMHEVAWGVFPALATEVPVMKHLSSTRAVTGRWECFTQGAGPTDHLGRNIVWHR
ncbi:hypothetical protein [Corynebacterium diphtheriae]|uniref:hypothetical protein n=2 Tax=Corynebacterium diphtheriae TaxID=1717 RepID=UPI001F533852|nr:hypothetical protein [Corynebacterium diphtheriae]